MRLSQTALNLLRNCPLCFWLEKVKKIKRPRGIFPSLPGGMDKIIKASFDQYRLAGYIPPMFKTMVPGAQLVEMPLIRTWRNWRSGLTWKIPGTEHVLIGALDEAIFFPVSRTRPITYAPVDYKTRGSAVPDWQAYVKKYYQTQVDVYDLLLQKNGYPTTGKGYFVYFYPESVDVDTGLCKFDIPLVEIETSADNALNLVQEAIAVIEGPMPESGPECEYCAREAALSALNVGSMKEGE